MRPLFACFWYYPAKAGKAIRYLKKNLTVSHCSLDKKNFIRVILDDPDFYNTVFIFVMYTRTTFIQMPDHSDSDTYKFPLIPCTLYSSVSNKFCYTTLHSSVHQEQETFSIGEL